MNLDLKNPLMNASGVFSDTPHDLKVWERAGVGAVVAKSVTLDEKSPNKFNPCPLVPEQDLSLPYDVLVSKYLPSFILIRGEMNTINSMGLPGKGSDYWDAELSKVSFDVPLILSVASCTGDLSDYSRIIGKLDHHECIKAYEINASCPNVDKEIICFNLDSLNTILESIETSKPLSVKVSCYYDEGSLEPVRFKRGLAGQLYLDSDPVVQVPSRLDEGLLLKILDLLDDCSVKTVTSINTLPTTHPLLGPLRGGLSGKPVHDIAVKQARFISDYSSLDIIGVGGIFDYGDAEDFLEIPGVKAVQLGSGLFHYENNVKNFVESVRFAGKVL